MKNRSVLCTSLLVVLLLYTSSIKAATFPIPGHGNLEIKTSTGWKVDMRSVVNPPALNLMVRPATGDAWSLQTTTVFLDAERMKKVSPEANRQNLQDAAKELLSQSVERTVEIKELKGKQSTGGYFALTDRAPAPGEYKYLIQGAMMNDQVLTSFTLLSHEKDSVEIQQILKMLADAAYSK